MSACPGCGLANYDGLCPVCRGDEVAYEHELAPFFGPWHDDPDKDERDAEDYRRSYAIGHLSGRGR